MNWEPFIYFLIACLLIGLLGKWARSGEGGKHWRDDEYLLKEHEKKNAWKDMDNYNQEQ